MDVVNTAQRARMLAKRTLMERNISIEISDYDERLIDEARATKGRVGPEVVIGEDPARREETVLISLRSKPDDTLVGFCAVKRCRLRGRHLGAYLFETYSAQYCGGDRPFEMLELPQFVETIDENVAYIGDLWLEPRRRIDITAFSIIAQSVAHNDLGARWNYFFTKHRNAWRGLAARYLATQAVPWAIRWLRPVEHRRNDDWMFVSRFDEFARAERIFVQAGGRLSGG